VQVHKQVQVELVLSFCINSTRGRGHESPRWVRALEKGDGTIGSHPLEPLSSHGDNTNTNPWRVQRGTSAVFNGSP